MCSEVIMSRRWILFAGFVKRIEATRLLKGAMFGEMMGGVGLRGGCRKRSRCGVSWTTSEYSVSTPTSRQLQARTRENGARRLNTKQNVS